MKYLIVAITILLSTASMAQSYTEAEEEAIQTSIMQKSTHKKGALFIGYDVNWLNHISVWLQERRYSHIATPQGDNVWRATFKPVSPGRSKDAVLKIAAQHDNNMKTTSVTITGTPDELIELFVYYWNDTHISLNKLKQGGYIYQDSGTDRITFDWKGTRPVIKIMSNPDAPSITLR